MLKKLGAGSLSLSIALLSFGPEAARAVVVETVVRETPSVLPVAPEIPRITSLDQLSLSPLTLPSVAPVVSMPNLEAPLSPEAQAASPEAGKIFAADMARLEAPSAVAALPESASAESYAGAGGGEFSARVLGEKGAPSASAVPASAGAGFSTLKPAARLSKPSVDHRSPVFPAVFGGAFGAAAALIKGAAGLAAPVAAAGVHATAWAAAPHVALLALAATLAIPAVLLLPRAAWESIQFAWVTRKGRAVTDDQFRRFVEGEILAGRLDGGVARLIRIYRPKAGWDMALGWHSSGAIALRPELAATPAVFRSVLAHEFRHYKELKSRGPPKRGLLGALWRRSVSEVSARVLELHGTAALKSSKIPAMERALREAQLSLNLEQPYELLLLNPQNAELKDPELYKNLSSGRARVQTVSSAKPQDLLGDPDNARRYKAVVMDRPDALLPLAGSTEAKKLDLALQQLDSLYLLATRRMTAGESAFRPGTGEIQRYRELAQIAKTMTKGDKKEVKALEKKVKDFWHQIASTRLKGVGPADFIEKLYDGLKDKGLAFLSFGPADPGVLVWERLLRYWEANDGGEFRTVRVDLEDGGHIMILRKVEARVGLWLKPLSGVIEESVPNASASPESQAKARAVMAQAGFVDQLGAFAALQEAVGGEAARRDFKAKLAHARDGFTKALKEGAVADKKAFAEAWLEIGGVAESVVGKDGLKEFDGLTETYTRAAGAADSVAAAEPLARLAAFAAGLAAKLDAPAPDFSKSVAAARAEVESAKSADSLKLFDDAAAALTTAPDLKTVVQSLTELRTSLERSGLRNYLTMLSDLDVEIRDVFGRDAGRQEIYVSLPRRNAAAIRKLSVGSSVTIGSSRSGFQVMLMDSAKIQNVPEVWKQGFTGEGAEVMAIDTGGKSVHEDFGDRDEGVDMMHEGQEDWIGHSHHVRGIVASSNPGFLGMAKAVRTVGAKVFGRDSPGASDGDIMGAGTIGLQRGVDVINLSLGSRGTSSDNLAKFFSELTLQKNGKGEHVIVVASAGNSGPFDETISQPSAGENVISVAAAAKSEDDGVPEISFFSSAGPDRPSDSAVEWVEIKPDITAIGGDVVTDPGDANVYKKGVYSAKSKDMPAGPSDTPDKKHTGMSGTSMASPMISGIATLVKLALKAARAMRDFVYENLPLSVKAILMATAKDMGAPVWFQGAGFVDAGAAVRLVMSSVSGSVRFRLSRAPGLGFLAPAAGADSWAWIERYKAVLEVGRKIRQTAEVAKTEAQARFEEDGPDETEGDPQTERATVGDKVYAEIVKKFKAAREEALPALLAALKDESWLVRRQAALFLLNTRDANAAQALLDAGLKDGDARVRQMAWLALARNPAKALDREIKLAAADPRPDVSMYAAYALARRGDASEVARIAAFAKRDAAQKNSDGKQKRYSAVWLLGQLGAKTGADEARALSASVRDTDERGNIRHLAAAALFNIAQARPAALTDQVFLDLLSAAGPQNLALTRTISKFFPAAFQDRKVVALVKVEPVRSAATDFVLKNRAAAQGAGALGELVTLLAKTLELPLDVPTPLPDPGGLGVAGVDPALGPLDVIVEAGEGAKPLEAGALARYGASLEAALPVSRSLWVRVPEHKLFAFSLEMRRLGYGARLSRPYYPTAAPAAAGEGTSIDLSLEKPYLPSGAEVGLVRLSASRGTSEAKVMAALEEVRAKAADPLKTPSLVALALAGPVVVKDGRADRGPLGELINRLILDNMMIVVSAGNGGPSEGSLASPADAGLAAVVAAAGEKTGLQFYSARGVDDAPGVSWTDLVSDADLAGLAKAATDAALGVAPAAAASAVYGTGAAAARSAEKLWTLAKSLAKNYISANGLLPDGFHLYLVDLVRQTLSAMPAHKISEVGGGLFADEAKAAALLEQGLKDPVAVARRSGELISLARSRNQASASALKQGLTFWDRMKDPYSRAAKAALPRGLHKTADMAERAALSLSSVIKAAPGPRGPPKAAAGWWKDPSVSHQAVTVPVFSLRRAKDDPGIGKFTDLASFYKTELAPQGVDTVLLLPHFAVLDESPYAPVSLYALNEDNIDWGAKGQDSSAVDYAAVRARETAASQAAWRKFKKDELSKDTDKAKEYRDFAAKNAAWLGEYAEFMALSKMLGKPALEWTAAEVSRAKASAGFGEAAELHSFAQWTAHAQMRATLDQIHAAGGKVLFDIPMFRSKNSVDAYKRPELFTDLAKRNPGIKNQWVNEDWLDLALWNWSKTREDGYQAQLAPFAHWLDFGFDGGRVDALHFAYRFGNGQLASGDEPGEEYVQALGAVFASRGALGVAEAFEGKDGDAKKHGFLTVYGDWKKVSTHDDARSLGFLSRLLGALKDSFSGNNGRFAAYALGDEWGDPVGIKEVRDGRSYWRYRVPLPGDANYSTRVRGDARAQLRALNALKTGGIWSDRAAVTSVLKEAGDGFVKHAGGSTQIWAASMDWFLEEWGRDTFVSLPGLLLSTGRFEEAKQVMRRFASFEKDGLIPNKINDGKAEYNTVDAPLWFIQAVKAYGEATGDKKFVAEMTPVMTRVVSRYASGTGYERFGRMNRIAMDADGLIVSPAQATWMDADPDGRDRPVTPRNGKAVEINALWYSALRFVAKTSGDKALEALADKVKASFNEKFWFETDDNKKAWGGTGGALKDVIEGDPHEAAIRPNMVFAVSVGGDLLSFERQKAVVLAATKDLLTPYGLRTLSPRDSHYRGIYETSKPPIEKDQAYHQGTAWPWLMGAYLDALSRVRRGQGWSDARIKDEQLGLLAPLAEFLVTHEQGSLPEVFDGGTADQAMEKVSLDDPAGLKTVFARRTSNQNPGGTRSQAWSVAEVLRALTR